MGEGEGRAIVMQPDFIRIDLVPTGILAFCQKEKNRRRSRAGAICRRRSRSLTIPSALGVRSKVELANKIACSSSR